MKEILNTRTSRLGLLVLVLKIFLYNVVSTGKLKSYYMQ